MGYMDLMMSYTNKMRIVEAPASGGGLSQNGKFSYGYASSAGKRPSMEDFFETRVDGIDGEIVGLFGVFDGHGGAMAAEYVKRHLFSNLITHPKFISDTKSAIADAYTHTDSELLKSENSHTRDAGSTASTAILVGDRLLVANVGDSRAVICRGGNAFAVSRDHKPDQSDERERIENAGGFVMWAGTWRVGGVLAVSRAFGDRLLKQYVVADPEIQEEKIDDSLEFLILASDGLWDVFSNEEAVAVVKEVGDPEESSKKLVGEAIQRGSADNITCVVVRFLESKTGNDDSCSSSQEANQEKIAVKNDSDHKSSAKETIQDLNAVHTNTEVETLNQKPTAARSEDSSTQKPVSVTAAGGRSSSVSSEQSGSAKETNQGHTAVHTDTKEETLDQKPIAARGVDSSTKKPVAVTAAGGSRSRVSSEQISSAKETKQGHTAVHTNTIDGTLNQKPIAAKSDDSSTQKPVVVTAAGGSSTQKPVAVTAAGGRSSSVSSEQSGAAKETNKNRTTVHTNTKDETLNQKPVSVRSDYSSTQKPVGVTAGRGRHSNVPSEQSGSVKETNQDLTAVHTDNKDEGLYQKPIAARSDNSSTQKPITVTEAESRRSSVSSDKNGSAREMPIAIHNGSEAKSSAKVPNQEKMTSDNDLDRSISKQKPVAATHTTSSEQSGGSHGEKNRKPNTVQSDSATSKASSVLTTSNKNAH